MTDRLDRMPVACIDCPKCGKENVVGEPRRPVLVQFDQQRQITWPGGPAFRAFTIHHKKDRGVPSSKLALDFFSWRERVEDKISSCLKG
jgi:hypothetical protein